LEILDLLLVGQQEQKRWITDIIRCTNFPPTQSNQLKICKTQPENMPKRRRTDALIAKF